MEIDKNRITNEGKLNNLKQSGFTTTHIKRASILERILKFFRMHVINTYLSKTVGVAFGMSLLIITFIMLMGSMVKIFELIFKKFSIMAIVHILAFIFPEVICYSLPFSMAAATLLVFSRLSADGEITAMKATGISIFRIAAPCITLSVVIAVIALYAYSNILPKAHFAQRNLISSYEIDDISGMIETGTWIPIGRYNLFVGKRDDKMYKDIHIIENKDDGSSRQIFTARSTVRTIRNENKLLFEMHDVVSEERSTQHTNSYIRTKAGRVDMYISLDTLMKKKSKIVVKKEADFTTSELKQKIDKNISEIVSIARKHKTNPKHLYSQLRTAKTLWNKLQNKKAWKKVLKIRKRKNKKAWVDNVANQKLHKDYENALISIDGKHGKTTKLFREWYKTWMPVNQINNYLEANSRMKTQVNYRYSYALASIAFAIIGIPLGIRAHRSEKTIGFLICLALIAIHYALVISITAFNDSYAFRPDLLVWVPDLLFILIGSALLWRLHRNS
ncbi:MAG: hypothetical protein DRI44_06145 [Chlamydiae bacterium]|nr:MAG: hypothetical protein DRI44_06145 [Chlamydiota bacterium]